MKNGYILFNPISGTGLNEENLAHLGQEMDANLTRMNVTEIKDYAALFATIRPDEILVVAGGDGTLNHFANNVDGLALPCPVYFYPCGSGNDFARDCDREKMCRPFEITDYLKDLPTVEVKGRKYRFINGVGFGIDGYCCEIGDEMRKVPGKKVNYTAIAIKGLLFDYVPTDAVVTVDGVRHEFKKAWLAPAMFGRFYGGGMLPAPEQNRQKQELSVMVFHGSGKLRTLMIFPGIFKGSHIKKEKFVKVLTGKEITVEFAQPRPLQVDGETILNVRSYTARR